ncbi:MAG: SMC-Scp complex subunit ScpB [Planctomycetota bacterium]
MSEPVEDDLLAVVEALLFASGEVVTLERLAQGIPRVDRKRIRAAVQALAEKYRTEERAFAIVEIAEGYRLMTRPEFYPYLARMFRGREMERLSPAALETLAIVAYRQPVTRGDIESIRGVQSDAVLKALIDRKLIRVCGRAEVIGRPRLYGTTRRFLDLFGLAGLEDLPQVEGREGERAG